MESASGVSIKTILGVGGASPHSKAKEHPFQKMWSCGGSFLKSASVMNGWVKVGTMSMHSLGK